MKKIAALFVFATLAVCVLSLTALANDAIGYEIAINGEEFTSEKLEIDCGKGKATYDPDTKTLTLDNAEITVNKNFNCGIETGNDFKSDLKIVLIGTNTITTSSNENCGIFSLDSIEISGAGSIKISGTSERGIETENLTVKSGTITIEKATENGINVKKNLIVEGGTIIAMGDIKAIEIRNNMTVSGGTIEATGKSEGIYIENKIDISGGKIIATGATESIGINAGEMTINKGTVEATGKIYGIYTFQTITVEGGSITATGKGIDGIMAGKIIMTKGTVTAKGLSCGISISEMQINNIEQNVPQLFANPPASKIIISGGNLVAEATDENGIALNMLPDVSNYDGLQWRNTKTGDFSKEAFPETLLNEKYFEIREKAKVGPSAVVHQIGEEKPVAVEEENPNTGADFASILCAGAAIVLAGAGAILNGKKH